MKKSAISEPDCDKIRCKTLIIQGEKYRTLYTEKFKKRKKWQKPEPNKVLSVLPGTVVEVFVKEGDSVKKDDTMMIIEAMKMQNTYYFPHSGKIKHVNLKVGDKIPRGFVMVEYY